MFLHFCHNSVWSAVQLLLARLAQPSGLLLLCHPPCSPHLAYAQPTLLHVPQHPLTKAGLFSCWTLLGCCFCCTRSRPTVFMKHTYRDLSGRQFCFIVLKSCHFCTIRECVLCCLLTTYATSVLISCRPEKHVGKLHASISKLRV